jgi:hypothetical protein
MRRKETATPTVGRPRSHAIKPGFRPQLAFKIPSELLLKIREAQAKSARTQSAECEHILTQHFLTPDPMARHHGANGPLLTIIANAADAARRLGESLAAGEGSDLDDIRIYSAILNTMRTTIAWTDPASGEKVINPQHVNGGALTWATVHLHASWIAYNYASADPKWLAAFKAIDAKFQKHKRTR